MQLSRGEVAKQVRVQENLVNLGIAELKMKPLEAKLQEIQAEGLLSEGSERYQILAPRIRKVIAEMESNIRDLHQGILYRKE